MAVSKRYAGEQETFGGNRNKELTNGYFHLQLYATCLFVPPSVFLPLQQGFLPHDLSVTPTMDIGKAGTVRSDESDS